MSVNGIEIKVGQKWSTRRGFTTEILRATGSDTHTWSTDGGWVTDSGRVSVHGGVIHDEGRDLATLICQPEDIPGICDLTEYLEANEPQVTMLEADSPDAESLAVETLSALGWVFDGTCWVQDHPSAYDKLADVLHRALLQASQGKGRERHAVDGVAFEDQPMATINKQLGSVHGYVYQCHKKSLEAMRLPAGRDVAELLGAINYLCGAVIALETWARKGD